MILGTDENTKRLINFLRVFCPFGLLEIYQRILSSEPNWGSYIFNEPPFNNDFKDYFESQSEWDEINKFSFQFNCFQFYVVMLLRRFIQK